MLTRKMIISDIYQIHYICLTPVNVLDLTMMNSSVDLMLFWCYFVFIGVSKKIEPFFPRCYTRCSPIISDFQLSNLCFSMAGFSQEATALWGRSITGALWRSPGHPGCRPTHTLASGMMWRQVVAPKRSRWKIHGEWIPQKKKQCSCFMPNARKKGSLVYRWFDYKMHHQGYSLDMFISFRAQHKRW